MKQVYLWRLFSGSLLIMLHLLTPAAKAQCPYGISPGTTMYDTVINTPAGINTILVKLPQADPMAGMVTCLQICVSITGVVDSVSVENNSASPQNADVYYIRTDQITGPGLSSPLTNSINHHYGPYALGSSNGVLGSGPDFTSISRDTLLNAVTVCRTVNTMDSLMQFYGHDSVTYMYNITAFTNVTCTGGNYNSTVATSAIVRFHFQYCTCPGYVLPLNLRQFAVNRVADNKAKLSWYGYKDPSAMYYFETEVSRDGQHFSQAGRVTKEEAADDRYEFIYTNNREESGSFYFRVKQVYANGYTRLSEIREITLRNSTIPKFFISPNPSEGAVGIKFVNKGTGQFKLEIYNAQGQKAVEKDIVVTGSSYYQLTSLTSGMYWIRVTEKTTQESGVSQLIIK
jgi:hypothetical protein